MDLRLRFIWFITVFAGVVILFDQLFHFHTLYQEKKKTYTHEQNNRIKNAMYEFNMKTTNSKKTGNILSFSAEYNLLIYSIQGKQIQYKLNIKDDISQIKIRAIYDIRDSELWTLNNFYQYLQAKQDSSMARNLAIQFFIQDSTGKIKDTYPKQFKKLPSSFEYNEPLGYISKDTLFATYHYPIMLFIQATSGQILLIILITMTLILCILNLYLSFRDEKKSGEYREQFIHNIVHDLKRPLENQIKLCGVLPDIPEAERAKFLEESRTQLKGMSQSINRMLLQSTDAHGLRLNLKEFDLREMLETLTQPNRWKVEEGKEFHIRLQFLSSDQMITGDFDFLQAVFQNFIDNSLKYSGTRAEVIITCADLDERNLQIEIKDNGLGISPEALKHVFERYHRGDHQGDKEIKGHGQGLYYARMVIKAHRGKIEVSSSPGQGTTITVILPKNLKTQKH